MYERVLASEERTLCADDPETLKTVNGLASVLMQQGKYDEAKAMYERGGRGQERALGADHPARCRPSTTWRLVLRQQGKLDEAKAMYERALAGQERALGADHPTRWRPSATWRSSSGAGRSSTRRRLNERVLAAKADARRGPPQHAGTVGNLAIVSGGRASSTRRRRCERVLAAELPARPPRTLGTVGNLAIVLAAAGQARRGDRRCTSGRSRRRAGARRGPPQHAEDRRQPGERPSCSRASSTRRRRCTSG